MYYSKVVSLLEMVLVVFGVSMLFLVIFLPHQNQMPQHVDSWILLSSVRQIIQGEWVSNREPFTDTVSSYPKGSYVYVALITMLTGLDELQVEQLLPGVIFVVIGLLQYALALRLFQNRIIAVLSLFFTLLVISNMAMLGPFYLVPISFGVVLFLLFLYLLAADRLLLALFVYFSIALTHLSTAILATIVLLFYFLLTHHRKHILYLFFFFLIALFGFLSLRITAFSQLFSGQFFALFFQQVSVFFTYLFIYPLEKPFINFSIQLTSIFFFFIAVGLFFICVAEKKALKIIIPLITLLALDLYLFWSTETGYILPYRRVLFALFLFMPLFVSYGLFKVVDLVSRTFLLITPNTLTRIIHYSRILFVPLLLILVPKAISINMNAHPSMIWVGPEEHELFKTFGEQYPGSYVLTDHLEAFSLPYYNLKPIMISPFHVGDSSSFNTLFFPYINRDGDTIASVFAKNTSYNFVYYYDIFHASQFFPVAEYSNLYIYQYNRSIGNITPPQKPETTTLN